MSEKKKMLIKMKESWNVSKKMYDKLNTDREELIAAKDISINFQVVFLSFLYVIE